MSWEPYSLGTALLSVKPIAFPEYQEVRLKQNRRKTVGKTVTASDAEVHLPTSDVAPSGPCLADEIEGYRQQYHFEMLLCF